MSQAPKSGVLEIHDSMSRSLQPVQAVDGKMLRMYCCGPTVYGPAHIGNFRTFTVQDLFRRVVELSGVRVKHVRNLTDVDDKTIRESQAAGEALRSFTDRWTRAFHQDCSALNLLPPVIEPSAVEHIPDMVAMIESLMEQGYAYQGADQSVYFKISAFKDYGKLSRLDSRQLKPGASETANCSDEYTKDSISDFALWKARKPEDGENYWESPWGQGRPGWHLECSAMSLKYLGNGFDVHSGGIDLLFPHHENEIAQSEASTGKTFVRLWFHVTHLIVEGKKMSKSLGNLFTLRDLLDRSHSAAEVRYVLLAAHYRQQLNFTFDSLHAARVGLQRLAKLEKTLRDLAGDAGGKPLKYRDLSGKPNLATEGNLGPFQPAWEALLSDLNTPESLGRIFIAAKDLEKRARAGEIEANEAGSALRGLEFMLHTLGFELPKPKAGDQTETTPDEVLKLAEARLEAKQAKDFAAADRLREEISSAGWVIRDKPGGYDLVKGDA